MPDEIDLNEDEERALEVAWEKLSREEQDRQTAQKAQQFNDQWQASSPPVNPPPAQ